MPAHLRYQTCLPSIWCAKFSNYDSWLEFLTNRFHDIIPLLESVITRGERDRQLVNGFCSFCQRIVEFNINWNTNDFCETLLCQNCQTNSRMRALCSFLLDIARVSGKEDVYIAEHITYAYLAYKKIFTNLYSSEFIDKEMRPGETRIVNGQLVRHEDLTNLSFNDDSMDLIITQHVFEHVFDCDKAFSECFRVLRPQGNLVFNLPFYYTNPQSFLRAVLESEGQIKHLLPPEFHGDPLSDNGILCTKNFGWNILDNLRGVGFNTVAAHLYWGPWEGHFTYPSFIFAATK